MKVTGRRSEWDKHQPMPPQETTDRDRVQADFERNREGRHRATSWWVKKSPFVKSIKWMLEFKKKEIWRFVESYNLTRDFKALRRWGERKQRKIGWIKRWGARKRCEDPWRWLTYVASSRNISLFILTFFFRRPGRGERMQCWVFKDSHKTKSKRLVCLCGM